MFFRIFRTRKRILLIDDGSDAAALKDTLKSARFEVAEAGPLAQLSRLVDSFHPHAILVGLSLPDFSGLDYLRELQRLHVPQPIVVLSDSPTLDTKMQARAYGAARYRRRPIAKNRLLSLLEGVLEEHEDKVVGRVFPATREEQALFSHGLIHERLEESLEALTMPRSVAVVGASETPGKAAERRTRTLLEGGFGGDFYPVNPRRQEIFGHPAYPSVADIPADEIDLAVLIIRREDVLDSIRQCCEKRAKAVVVITAGFGESDEGGKEVENEMLRIAAESGTRIVGPNCSGVFSAAGRVNVLGIPGIQPGPFSVIAQSGNVIGSLAYYAATHGTGFSRIFSAGNAIGFSFQDYLRFLNKDPDTRVIMLYLEGIREGPEFIEAARETVLNKPVVAIKVGNSEAGIRAAASHTAAVAASREIIDVAIRESGIIRANNIDEMFSLANALAFAPRPKGKRIVVMSEGGGDNAIAAENLERFDLRVPVLPKKLQKSVQELLLDRMPAHNPIDYGGVAEEDPQRIAKITELCLKDDSVDGVFITGFFGGFQEIITEKVGEAEKDTAGALIEHVEKYQKPVFVHSSFARSGAEALATLKRAGVPTFESGEMAARCLAALFNYEENRKRRADDTPVVHGAISENVQQKAAAILRDALRDGRRALLETEARDFLALYDLPVIPATFVPRLESLAKAIRNYSFPLAMKIVSPAILHKSDVGGVVVNLQNEAEAFHAFHTIMHDCAVVADAEDLLGVLVSPMAKKGPECIVGMVRDPVFGPVVMFGMGGILVEALKDVSFRVCPLLEGDALRMMKETLGFTLLIGHRGSAPADLVALETIIKSVAAIANNHPEIVEIDLNPVFANPQGATIVDGRIILGS